MELSFGAFGFLLPFTLIPIYFAAATYGWLEGASCAVLTGVWIDLNYGREFPITMFAMLAMVVVIWLFLREHGFSELSDAVISIFCSVLMAEFIISVGEFFDGVLSLSNMVFIFMQIIWNSVLGGVFILGSYTFLFFCSDRLGIGRIVNAKIARSGVSSWNVR